MGVEVLEFLLPFINYGVLAPECNIQELIDFLPFLGLVIHKFKVSIVIFNYQFC